MSYTDRVFKAMKSDFEYDPQTLATMTHLEVGDVGRCLRLLARGGVIEQTKSSHFIRKRKYKSKQRGIFA